MARTAIAAVVVALLAAVPAHALDFSASSSPETVVFPVTREVTYRLEMVNGPVPEHLSVFLRQPQFDPGGSPIEEGAALERVSVTFEGDGAISAVASTPAAGSQCSRPHGYGVEGHGVEVELPPLAAGALVATYRPPLFARWPDTALGLGFEVQARSGTQDLIAAPSPELAGPRGVELHVALGGARPATTIPAPIPLRARRGQRVAVEGRADRVIAGRRVALRIARAGGRARTFARPQVRRSGRFGTVRLRAPRRAGVYEIHASYRGDGERLASDRSCGRLLEVR